MRADIEITGEGIRLRPIEEHDLETKVQWINDPDVNKYLHYELPLELEKTQMWYKKIREDTSRYDFVIETTENGPVGLTGLIGIDPVHKTSEFYITIGEKALWYKGIGGDATKLLAQWAFEKLGMHKIWAIARTTNTASITMMQKVGFKTEGILREEKEVNNKRVDIIRLGLLRSDLKGTLQKRTVLRKRKRDVGHDNVQEPSS